MPAPFLAALASLVVLPGFAQDDQPAEKTKLLVGNEKLWDHWDHYSAEQLAFGEVWQLRKGVDENDLVLVCSGKPNCYLQTKQRYQNFEFHAEWMYPSDENGSSGILIHTSEKQKIWPDSIQIQLHRAKAGSVFPSGEAKSENVLPAPAETLSKKLKEWNWCTVTSVDGRISITVNNMKLGSVTGCNPNTGSIALQSEGSEIHFRNLWIKPLPASTTANQATSSD